MTGRLEELAWAGANVHSGCKPNGFAKWMKTRMDFPTGTITLAFTDIEGSSELSERLQIAFEPTRETHFRLLRESATRWNGLEVATAGDSIFLVFAQASDAVQWAVDAQKTFFAFDWPPDVGTLKVRMGMHTGQPYPHEDAGKPNYFGPAVNRAARVMGAGNGGQILLSDATRNNEALALPPDFAFQDMGIHRLKGVGDERLWQVNAPDLPAEFPTLHTLNPARHNLPPAPTPFLGREKEIADWQARLTGVAQNSTSTPSEAALLPPRTRLLTLTGFGGMGKTRAALHLAELCVERFEQGVCWIALEDAHTPDEMHLKVAQSLKFDLRPDSPLREQIFAFLAEREMLLALDNCEQISGIAAFVAALLKAAPKISLLVTSRAALDAQAETVVELRPFPLEEAERLFVERARARRDDFALTPENAADITALCQGLEGVPLALELAAARITALTPRQMLPRLQERFRLLQTRAPDLSPRQSALHAAIDWSYDLLAQEERDVFAQLAVFAGGFTLEDAEAVCQAEDIFESVLELRRHSFFGVETDKQTQQDRYVMLESLRAYAQERLAERSDGEAARQRHAEYFAWFGSERMALFRQAEEANALRELTRNLANLRAGLEWARSAARPPLIAELALLVGVTLARGGYIAQAAEPVQEGLDALSTLPDAQDNLMLELRLERAGLHLDQKEAPSARELAQQACLQAQTVGDVRNQARAENLLGRAAYAEDDFEGARQHYQRALELATTAKRPILEGIVRNNLGLLEHRAPDGNREQAQEHLRQALTLRRAHNDRRGQAETLNNLGLLAFESRDWEAAWNYYAEALQQEQELRHIFGVAYVLSNMGETAGEKGETERACRLFAVSERLLLDVNSHISPVVSEYLTQSAARCSRAKETFQEDIRGLSFEQMLAYACAA